MTARRVERGRQLNNLRARRIAANGSAAGPKPSMTGTFDLVSHQLTIRVLWIEPEAEPGTCGMMPMASLGFLENL